MQINQGIKSDTIRDYIPGQRVEIPPEIAFRRKKSEKKERKIRFLSSASFPHPMQTLARGRIDNPPQEKP